MERSSVPPPLVALCTLVLAVIAGPLAPLVELVPFPYNLAGLPVLGGGIALGLWQRSTMIRYRQPGYYTAVPTTLITDGPFRFSRNPLYFGMTLMTLGTALLFGGLGPLLVVLAGFVVMNVWAVPPEERVVARTFGEEYDAYRRRVRRWA